jgi:CIC family chloride channel protein
LLGLSLVVGVISGLGAIVFYAACQFVFHFALEVGAGYHPHNPGGEPPLFTETAGALRPWLLLLIPVLGGIVSGLIVFTFAPEAEGHGTDAAIAAYHHHQGQIRPRVPLVKIVASALTLGTGGSGGREGPIAQIGAGFGSFLGRIFRLAPAERRILMAAGMGAGIAAIFRAPLAGAMFAAEVLYRSPDFESEVIIPAGLASVIAYCGPLPCRAGNVLHPHILWPDPPVSPLDNSAPLQTRYRGVPHRLARRGSLLPSWS